MINRQVIRTRALQVAYAYLHKGEQKLSTAEADLRLALGRSYELYMYLLRLPIELSDFFAELQEIRSRKHLASHEDRNPNYRLQQNLFVAQLRACQALEDWYMQYPLVWREESILLRRLMEAIEGSDLYKSYLQSEPSYETDRAFWLNAFQQIIATSQDLAEYLEEQSIYWDDELCYTEKIECEERPNTDADAVEEAVRQAKETETYQSLRYDNGNVEIVKAFVVKSIKRAREGEDFADVLLPEYRDEDDENFALHLLRQTILGYSKTSDLIAKHLSQSWDKERLADLDELLMHMAVTEFLHFPKVATHVSINEYVELSKYYSTPRSSAFINGVLDAVAKELKSEGKILKQ